MIGGCPSPEHLRTHTTHNNHNHGYSLNRDNEKDNANEHNKHNTHTYIHNYDDNSNDTNNRSRTAHCTLHVWSATCATDCGAPGQAAVLVDRSRLVSASCYTPLDDLVRDFEPPPLVTPTRQDELVEHLGRARAPGGEVQG